ncbi:MAG TPA: MarR family transcriptional regulator [Caulobacteraceae bacterium]|nr:MarR family transcriptional regulator [Caulobacteraceae bacterium]
MDSINPEGALAAHHRQSPAVDPTGEVQFDTPTYLFHLFAVLQRHRDQRLDNDLQALGLNVALHRALSVIGRMEPCSMKQLAELAAVDRTTMTRTVDQLVRAGLVERSTPPSDRRQVLLNLTADGRQTLDQALRVIYRLNRAVLAGLDESAQRSFVRAERAMLVNLVPDETLRENLFRMDRPDQPD